MRICLQSILRPSAKSSCARSSTSASILRCTIWNPNFFPALTLAKPRTATASGCLRWSPCWRIVMLTQKNTSFQSHGRRSAVFTASVCQRSHFTVLRSGFFDKLTAPAARAAGAVLMIGFLICSLGNISPIERPVPVRSVSSG